MKKKMQIIKYDCKGKKENGRRGPQCHPKNLILNKKVLKKRGIQLKVRKIEIGMYRVYNYSII